MVLLAAVQLEVVLLAVVVVVAAVGVFVGVATQAPFLTPVEKVDVFKVQI